jgi:hypothetical protein
MLLTNETLLLLQSGLSSNGDKYMSCIVNMRLRLMTYYITVCLIHIIFLVAFVWLISLTMIFYAFSYSFRNMIRIIHVNIHVRSYEQRYFYWIIIMIKEIILILVYIFFGFFFNFFGFVNNDSSIRQMYFSRWFIEASFFPVLIVICLCTYYIKCMYDIFDEYQTIYIIVIMLKVPLFFWMRYAECQLDAFPNTLESFIRSVMCKAICEPNIFYKFSK